MGTISWQWITTGAEGHPSQWFAKRIPQFTGAVTFTVQVNAALGAIANLSFSLGHEVGGATCYTQGVSFGPSSTAIVTPFTVGNPPFAWSCTDWDTLFFGNTAASNNVPARTFTFTLDGPGISGDVPLCEYGVEQQSPIGSIVNVTPGFIGALLPVGGFWASAAIATVAAGTTIALDVLCSDVPRTPETVVASDWTTFEPPLHLSVAVRKLASNFSNELWHHFCRCKSGPAGSATPVAPPSTDWTRPAYYISTTINNVSNTDIANAINLILNVGGSNITVSNSTYSMLAKVHNCSCPEFAHGTVHGSLSGSGSLSVSGLVGMEVEVLSRGDTSLELLGQPPYLWDIGWQSIMQGSAMLDEKRLTRADHIWLPHRMDLADTWTYSLRNGVVIRATELVQAAELPTVEDWHILL